MRAFVGALSWTLTAAWPYAPLLEKSLETGQPVSGIFPPIPAEVPGSVQADLLRAGLIPHPYQKMNSAACEWVENRWWIYETAFRLVPKAGKRYFLRCAGVDHECLIYLNDRLIAEGEGMFLPVRAQITGALSAQGENRLRIVLKDAPREFGLGYTSRVRTQKSRFAYKWDFSTRLVHLGIWDEVWVEETGPAGIEETCVTTDYDPETDMGFIRVRAKADAPCGWAFTLSFKNKVLDHRASASGRAVFRVPGPVLWEIGTGAQQELYTVKIRALCGGAVSDSLDWETGVRRLRFLPNDGAPAEAPPYTVELNGKRRYVKGVNVVPLDQMYGCVDEGAYERFCRSLARANVNLVRVWGGGLVEKEAFYRWCDRLGILVWQEFIQSSSGVENVPPTDPGYLALLHKNAVAMLKVKRNHVCTAVYCGGNELRQRAGCDLPAKGDDPNLALLARLVKRLDPGRLFLPTSAFGPEEYVTSGRPETHWDVHGTWKYQGVSEHYELYNGNRSLFHSEFGADGMSSADAIRWILDDPGAGPSTMEDPVWRFHGEWWDTSARDEALFGPPSSLEEAVSRSQLIQAEAVRYPVEADRRRAFRNSGSLVWQFNEPWPNISCTSLTEYGGKPKLAYYFLRSAYAPRAATLAYETLCPAVGEPFSCSVAYVGDRPMGKGDTLRFLVRDSFGRVLMDERAQSGQVFTFPAPETEDDLFYITLILYEGSLLLYENTYFFSTSAGPYPLKDLTAPVKGLSVRMGGGKTRVSNRGERVLLYVHQEDCGVFTLFPGESRTFSGEKRDFETLWTGGGRKRT